MISKEVVKPDAGRVTAGLPLDSSQRFQHDTELVSRDYAQKIQAERIRNDELCLAPDGSRPTTIFGSSEGIKLSTQEFIRRLALLNPNFWFERSGSLPTELCAYLKVPVSDDYPKGLWFQFGFSGERPLIEFNWAHKKEKWVYTHIGQTKQAFPCKGCDECRTQGAFWGFIRGWRSLLKILVDNGVTTPASIARVFGPPSKDSRNWRIAIHGS